MIVDVFNKQNEKAGTIDLSEKIFDAKWNPSLVHQVLMVQLANRRESIAHTKGRGEVSGGGKKPWKQKGTGRARHGSIRSPIWKGGGVTFGPTKEKKYARKINKKMNRSAIFSVLSKKMEDKEIKIIDGFNKEIKKSKEWGKILSKIIGLKSRVLLVPASANNIHQSVANIRNVDAISAKSLNVYDLLKHKNIIFEKEAIGEAEKHYFKK